MSFSIITINAGMLEIQFPILSLIPIVKNRKKRFVKLCELINKESADIVIIQEINGSYKLQLIEKVKETYPFMATHKSNKIIESNLLTISKMPISESSFMPFPKSTVFESIFMQKGILKTVHKTSGGSFAVLNTHLVATGFLQNAEDRSVEKIRAKQIDMLTKTAEEMKELTIIGGDFNTGPEASRGDYKSLVYGLMDVFKIASNRSKNTFTWDPRNPYVQSVFRNSPSEQVDGFYIPKNYFNTKSIEANINIIGDKIPVSDHYGVRLEVVSIQNKSVL